MLIRNKIWPFSKGQSKNLKFQFGANCDKLGPYRNKSKPPIEKKMKPNLFFEEKIIQARMKIPGPIRRSMAVVLFLPIIILSFSAAILLAPFCWIIFGDLTYHWDCCYESDQYNFKNCWRREPLLIGTTALFKDKSKFYKQLREGRLHRIV